MKIKEVKMLLGADITDLEITKLNKFARSNYSCDICHKEPLFEVTKGEEGDEIFFLCEDCFEELKNI